MSRIGKMPVHIPEGVNVTLDDDNVLHVEGPKGSLFYKIEKCVELEIDNREIKIKRKDEGRKARSIHGLTRSIISNMVTGVKEGFTKGLEIVGVGYRADVQGNVLSLNIGYSHPVRYNLPEGIKANVEKQTLVTLQGPDKQLLGQVAAEIRSLRPPDPYKGKGIMYVGERIRRKAGKTSAK